jgi:hypothetical protein
MTVHAPRWRWLERWSATLFLVAGGFLLIHTGNHTLEAFTAMEYPLHHEVPFGFVGMTLGFVGLLGLYPRLADRSPTLAGAGAVLAVVGAVGWLVIGLSTLARDLGAAPPEWLGVFGLLIFVGVILGYLTFSVTGLRTEAVSLATGVALLTPLLAMAVNVGLVEAGFGSPAGQVVVASSFALAHLAIGVALRTEDGPSDYPQSSAEAAT